MYPILLKIGPLTIHTFGVMLAIGILVGANHLVRESRRLGDPRIDEKTLQRLMWWIVVAVIAGGRLMHVIVNLHEYADRPLAVFAIWEGGLAMYGGLLSVFVAVIAFAVKNHIKVLRLCDLAAPSCFLGDSIGRWGCFLVGDDYGKPTDSWVGVSFTNPDTLVPAHLRGIPLHPTQIYMSIKAFLIFVILTWITRRKKFDGQIAGWALILYAVFRSIVEIFRGDLDRGFVGPLSTSQFISIFVFAAGLLILMISPRRLLADELALAAATPAAKPKKHRAGARR